MLKFEIILVSLPIRGGIKLSFHYHIEVTKKMKLASRERNNRMKNKMYYEPDTTLICYKPVYILTN